MDVGVTLSNTSIDGTLYEMAIWNVTLLIKNPDTKKRPISNLTLHASLRYDQVSFEDVSSTRVRAFLGTLLATQEIRVGAQFLSMKQYDILNNGDQNDALVSRFVMDDEEFGIGIDLKYKFADDNNDRGGAFCHPLRQANKSGDFLAKHGLELDWGSREFVQPPPKFVDFTVSIHLDLGG
ncbi:uncharacterized protein G2W53_030528 [Senna tora]|uniref:Uncharacterized protein n=1 Tax=Senna tora TaxID=362788 RepID=A0A834WGV3_9FABA|nr:uncharacterized protein G2W53_030528 [Senna tora]